MEFDLSQLNDSIRLKLERAMEITKEVGGPLADTLQRIASVVTRLELSRQELEVAIAGPKASTRLVLSLPILVFVGAGISGLPVVRILFQPSLVWLSLLLGLFLFWIGARWTKKLLVNAEPSFVDPGFELDLVALALSAGMPLSVSCDLVGVQAALVTESSSGISMTELIREQADEARAEQHRSDRLKIQKASVAILWPLGLTVLPAFIFMAIIPIAVALMEGKQ